VSASATMSAPANNDQSTVSDAATQSASAQQQTQATESADGVTSDAVPSGSESAVPLSDTAIIAIAAVSSVVLVAVAVVVVFVICKRSRPSTPDNIASVGVTSYDMQFFSPPTIGKSNAAAAIASLPPHLRTSSHDVVTDPQHWSPAPQLDVDVRTSSHDALLTAPLRQSSQPAGMAPASAVGGSAMPTMMLSNEFSGTMATMEMQRAAAAGRPSTWDVDL
jgi:hypothetical protein